jgi:MATE family multidrug resistance protein
MDRSAHLWRREAIAMTRLALPMAAANLLQMAVYAIDVIFVARLGQTPLAASSLCVSLFGLLAWSLSAMTGAVAALVSAELGARRHAVRAVRRSTRMALWLAVMAGAVAMLICTQGRAIMLATGQSGEIADLSGGFLDVLKWAIVPMLIANVLRSVVSALGRPLFATAITALAIGVNACGNYALVFGHWGVPALGLRGSAFSSVLTGCFSALAYIAVLLGDRRLRRYFLLGHFWRPDWHRFAQILRIGAPIFLQVLAEAGLFSAAAFLMGRIGQAELAAHTVALQIAAFTFQIPMGIGQAATIRTGYFFGAGDRAGMARAGSAALAIGLSISLFSSGLMIVAPRLLISAYIEPAANVALVGLASRYLLVAAAFQLVDSAQAIVAGALRGLQDTQVPMGIALMGYWLPGFGTSVVLGLFTPLRGMGVWIGLATGLAVVAVALLYRWNARERLGLVQTPPL